MQSRVRVNRFSTFSRIIRAMNAEFRLSAELTLAVETSSREGAIAIGHGDALLETRRLAPDSRHASELLPAIKELIEDHGGRFRDLGLLIFSHGPGSFTGLRIAATVAALAQSTTGCRVVAVPSLMVIASNALRLPACPRRIVALLDAKSDRVYAAVYERVAMDELAPRIEPGLFDPADFLHTLEPPFCVVGEGVKQHRPACESTGGLLLSEEYWPPLVENAYRLGRRLAAAGRVCTPDQIVPLYLRPPACEEVYEQRREQARRKRGET